MIEAGGLSLDFIIDVLRRPTPKYFDRKHIAGANIIMRTKAIAAQIATTMLMRTNDQQLKKRQIDQLPDLIRLIKSEEKKLPLIDGRAYSSDQKIPNSPDSGDRSDSEPCP